MKNSELAKLPINQPSEFYKLSKEKQDILVEWCWDNLNRHILKTKSNLVSSYTLKHLFERNNFYVNNGAMKGALKVAGFNSYNENQINWMYALSKKVTSLNN